MGGDVTEDLNFPKIQFPSADMCAACWKTSSTSSNELIHDENVIFSFLKRFYDPKLIVMDFNMTETVLNNDIDKDQRKQDWKEWKQRSNKKTGVQVGIVDAALHDRIVKTSVVEKYENISSSTSWLGFSFFDTSLCVIFYMFCVILLLVGYLKFMSRNRLCFRMFTRAKKTWYPPV